MHLTNEFEELEASYILNSLGFVCCANVLIIQVVFRSVLFDVVRLY